MRDATKLAKSLINTAKMEAHANSLPQLDLFITLKNLLNVEIDELTEDQTQGDEWDDDDDDFDDDDGYDDFDDLE